MPQDNIMHEKLNDRTCIVLTDDLKNIIRRRAEASERTFSQQIRRDLTDYYRAISNGTERNAAR